MPSYDPATFEPLSFHLAVAGFQAGSDTPRDFLERCLETVSCREPAVRAWVSMNVDGSRAAADASTRRWREQAPLSQIDGLPIGIKDLLETRDMPTGMGCAAYREHFPRRDNAAVWALREAGAVVLGKTVTTELGGAEPGPTTNPFDSGHTPGGSSSGSAAVVAARMVPAAIGTQVGGSICRPASFCANYALKPSQGAINRGERLASSMSTHGPHAGTLEDMWAVAIEIARRAGGDPGYLPLAGPLDLPPVRRPAVLAVMESDGWRDLDAASLAAFDAVLEQLVIAGVAIRRRHDELELDRFEALLNGATKLNIDITAYENQWNLRNLVAEYPNGVSARGKSGLIIAEKLGVDGYQELLRKRDQLRRCFAALSSVADAVIAPASLGPAPRWSPEIEIPPGVIATGDPVLNTPGSLLGAPVVVLPLTAVAGLPMGIQLMGQVGKDADVTAIARWMRDTIRPVSL